jgi:hypothetical protein
MGKGKMHVNSWVENLEERKCLKFIGRKIILTLILKTEVGRCILDSLAQGREWWWWWSVFSTVMKHLIP